MSTRFQPLPARSRWRPHWIRLLPALLRAVASAFAITVAALALQSHILFLFGLAFGFGQFMATYLPWSREEVRLLGQFLVVQRGVLRRHVQSFPLHDVDAIGTDQFASGRLFNYADVTIYSGVANETILALAAVSDFMRCYHVVSTLLTQPRVAPRLALGRELVPLAPREPGALPGMREAEPSSDVIEGRLRQITHDIDPPPPLEENPRQGLENQFLLVLCLTSFALFFLVLWWMITTGII